MNATKKRTPADADVVQMADKLAALTVMTVGELCARYREVFGEPTRSRNKWYLQRKIAWGLQEQAGGGLSERTQERIDELADTVPSRWRHKLPELGELAPPPPPKKRKSKRKRDPRLPAPGAVLSRVFDGERHDVTVHRDDFAYDGRRFDNLSQVARAITGTRWNGFLFFGLQTRGSGKARKAK
ncbi:DUF2924 domain-containing protein [Haliangium ochraceum]|uniref:Putative bacteriophage related protein n=1 Tax=Haliangium ochraceum (strain DSM 14365 / JCM 11303 / SMP-2) TaxID=502025 RepID=D0LQR8_HALO1|nr:DUF2924 domain-containing protein [Haliangium ochraceum]ACY13628.1 putative bacteriophage related protein [Haliangium ochraceum DSM 14365]